MFTSMAMAWSEIRERAARIEGILRDERRGAYRLTDEQRAAYKSELSALYEQAREIEERYTRD